MAFGGIFNEFSQNAQEVNGESESKELDLGEVLIANN